MEDFSIPARERFIQRLKSREEFMTIPERGTKIHSFVNMLNSDNGISIEVQVDDRGRKSYRQDASRRNMDRKIIVNHLRMDIGKHPDVEHGMIIQDVAEDYRPTLERTLTFVNLYLGLNIDVTDVNASFFNPKGKQLTIRIRKNSLRYFGELKVHLV